MEELSAAEAYAAAALFALALQETLAEVRRARESAQRERERGERAKRETGS
jgi:hypothetical protein